MYKLAATKVLALAAAGSAQAMTTITSTNGPDTGPLPGQTVMYDFESGTPAGLTGNFAIVQGSVPGAYAAPLGDPSHYLAVPINGTSGSATLTLSKALTSVSFYWGSIDTYNTVSFYNAANGLIASFTGSQVPPAPADGSQGNALDNRRVNFDFGGAAASSIVFTSTEHAFELDNIAGASAVPEPATWAMLMVGLGLVGAASRRQRNSVIA